MSKKSQIHGIKSKTPPSHPIIEILGPVDRGKTIIAKTLARRIIGTSFIFPSLNPNSATGMALLKALVSTELLFENPMWWAHIYSAHLFEFKADIEEARKHGPVVVTNYTKAFSIWNKALEINPEVLSTFNRSLPKVDNAYAILGEVPIHTDRPVFQFPAEFKRKIKKSMLWPSDRSIVKVSTGADYSKFNYICLNNVLTTLTGHIQKRHDIAVDFTVLFTENQFPLKKDL